MTATSWLIDKSAYARLYKTPDRELWRDRIARGLVRVTTATLLEIGFSARNAQDQDPLLNALLIEYLTPRIEDRALEVQRLLTARQHHRALAVSDLLIAATAELTDLTVLHHDHDFELVREITGQPLEWLTLG